MPDRPSSAFALLLTLAACAGGPSSPPEATSGELRVLTYNVAGLPDGLSRANGALLDRMPAISALLHDYDLVGMQEDFDARGHAALTEGTGHAQITWFSSPLNDTRVYGSGLSQLLPQEAVAYHEQHYTMCHGIVDRGSDCLASKGVQVATLQLGGHALDVYNTHHEAGGGPDDLTARSAQVDEVLAAVADRSEDHAVVLMGDFNLHPDDAEDAEPLARYDAAGLARGCDLVGCSEPNHIDQIRVRSSGRLTLEVLDWSREERFVTDDGVDLSDHPAIAVTVAWTVDPG